MPASEDVDRAWVNFKQLMDDAERAYDEWAREALGLNAPMPPFDGSRASTAHDEVMAADFAKRCERAEWELAQ